MDRIFISYRREDSAATCGRIYDRLVARFGRDNVFKDVESIPLGVNFEHYIGDVVSQCAVQLVIMGPTWVDVPTDDGQRRLDDPGDLVRVEIEAALKRNIPVIPVLVQGATLPRAASLPTSIQELVSRNGIPVRYDPDFEPDVARLINALETWMAGRSASQSGLAGAAPNSVPLGNGATAPSGRAPQPGMPTSSTSPMSQGAGAPPIQPGGMPSAGAAATQMPPSPMWGSPQAGAMPPSGMPPAGMPQAQPGAMPPAGMPPGGMSSGMMLPGGMPPGSIQGQPANHPSSAVPPHPGMPPYQSPPSYQGVPSYPSTAPTFQGASSYQPAPQQMHPMMTGGGAPTQPGGPSGGQPGGGGRRGNMGLIIGAVAAVLIVALIASVLLVLSSQSHNTANVPPSPTHTPSATATPTPKVVYQSTLNSQTATQGWIVTSGCTYDTDGTHALANPDAFCFAPTEANVTDGTIAVQMKEVAASTDTSTKGIFGIAFRAVSSVDNFTGYSFYINDIGQWCFDKTLTPGVSNDQPVKGCDNSASAAIRSGVGATNTVSVQMKGSTFTFTVNGEVIATANDPDISSQTVVGLFDFGTNEEVVFTNFSVSV